MQRRSKHYGDLIKWVESIIVSCTTHDHIKCAQKIINNLNEHSSFKQMPWIEHHEIIRNLRILLMDQQTEIFSKKGLVD